MAGYLFVHFTGEQQYGEQIYFSISRDGLHWKDLNDGKPILYSETGMKGVEESEFILKTVSTLGVKSEVELDLTLARGLNYYTGCTDWQYQRWRPL